jgi:hypothetical protein
MKHGITGAVLLLLGMMSVVVAGCRSSSPPPPPSWPPADFPSYRPPPPPPRDQCQESFDPCRCDIWKYQIESLETLLSQSNWSPARRQEVAANISDVADFYKREYWSNRNQEDALRALRHYSAYLSLVALSDRSAPFALLHSIAIYCNLGCRQKADDLTNELQSNYSYQPADLATARRDCR